MEQWGGGGGQASLPLGVLEGSVEQWVSCLAHLERGGVRVGIQPAVTCYRGYRPPFSKQQASVTPVSRLSRWLTSTCDAPLWGVRGGGLSSRKLTAHVRCTPMGRTCIWAVVKEVNRPPALSYCAAPTRARRGLRRRHPPRPRRPAWRPRRGYTASSAPGHGAAAHGPRQGKLHAIWVRVHLFGMVT